MTFKARQVGNNAWKRAASRAATASSEIGTDALLSPGALPVGICAAGEGDT